jgi:hypothetical protein
MRDLRNSMVSLGKTVSDVKLILKILRSLPEHFRMKVTTIEESKDLEEMKIEELVGSLQTYELYLAKIFGRLVRNEWFKKKFSEKMKVPREAEPEEAEKKDPRGLRCFECSGFIYGLIVETSSRVRGTHITRLSVMSPKKKKLLSKRNF